MENAEDYNYDFNYNMFLTKTMLPNLESHTDRQLVVRWIRKLTQSNRSLEEMRLRNDFMYYLVLSVQSGQMKAPFNDNPPAGPLPAIAQLLPGGAEMTGPRMNTADGCWAEDMDQEKPDRPMLYRCSPDGGAFLAAQPIPKCGAFCYLAVVSKKDDE